MTKRVVAQTAAVLLVVGIGGCHGGMLILGDDTQLLAVGNGDGGEPLDAELDVVALPFIDSGDDGGPRPCAEVNGICVDKPILGCAANSTGICASGQTCCRSSCGPAGSPVNQCDGGPMPAVFAPDQCKAAYVCGRIDCAAAGATCATACSGPTDDVAYSCPNAGDHCCVPLQ